MPAKTSKRFIPSTLTEKIVPVIFALIAVLLAVVLAVTVLSVLGITPGA